MRQNKHKLMNVLFGLNTIKRFLTIIPVVGDVPWSMRGNDDGQQDETEHEREDDQVEHDKEAQERKVGQDPCSKHS